MKIVLNGGVKSDRMGGIVLPEQKGDWEAGKMTEGLIVPPLDQVLSVKLECGIELIT